MYIGSKVRALRKRLGMTLVELSEKSAVQLATLSRLEHHRMVGTLQCHLQIAKALGVEVTELYSEIIPENRTVSIKKDSADVFMDNKKASYELLANQVSNKKMMPTLLKIDPGGKTTQEQQSAGSEKFIFVMEGKLDVNISGKNYSLSKGNSLYFKASMPHHFINPGKSAARMLCVLTPVTF